METCSANRRSKPGCGLASRFLNSLSEQCSIVPKVVGRNNFGAVSCEVRHPAWNPSCHAPRSLRNLSKASVSSLKSKNSSRSPRGSHGCGLSSRSSARYSNTVMARSSLRWRRNTEIFLEQIYSLLWKVRFQRRWQMIEVDVRFFRIFATSARNLNYKGNPILLPAPSDWLGRKGGPLSRNDPNFEADWKKFVHVV